MYLQDVPLGEITNLRPLESTVEDPVSSLRTNLRPSKSTVEGPVSGLRPSESIVEGPVSGLRKPSHGDINTAKRPCVSRNGMFFCIFRDAYTHGIGGNRDLSRESSNMD